MRSLALYLVRRSRIRFFLFRLFSLSLLFFCAFAFILWTDTDRLTWGFVFIFISAVSQLSSSLFLVLFEKSTVRAVHLSGERSYDYLFPLLLPSLSDVPLPYRTAYVQYVPEYAGDSAVAKDAC